MASQKISLKITGWVIVVGVALWLGVSTRWLSLGAPWRYVSRPVTAISNIFLVRLKYFWQAPELSRQLTALKNEVALQKSSDFLLLKLQQENTKLKQLLKFKPPSNVSVRSAQIIGRILGDDNFGYVIDIGSNDGLEMGEAVVSMKTDSMSEKVVLLGVVGRVDTTQSIIWPTSSYHAAVVGQVASRTGVSGLVRGEYNLGLRLTMVPADDEISPGDWVATSHLNEKVPAGILIGKVTVVDSPPGELFKSAIIEPFLTMADVNVVSVLVNK